eukprot:3336623-Prymnesium_polylepis.1
MRHRAFEPSGAIRSADSGSSACPRRRATATLTLAPLRSGQKPTTVCERRESTVCPATGPMPAAPLLLIHRGERCMLPYSDINDNPCPSLGCNRSRVSHPRRVARGPRTGPDTH